MSAEIKRKLGHAGLVDAIARLPGAEQNLASLDRRALRLEIISGFEQIAELPRATPTSSKTACAELLELAKLADALTAHLGKMHSNSLAQIEVAAGRHWIQIGRDLEALGSTAKAGAQQLEREQIAARSGRPRKIAAREVAAAAAGTYRAITGTSPTVSTTTDGKAYGRFLDFLTEVFLALGINAGAEQFAKQACKEKMPSELGS